MLALLSLCDILEQILFCFLIYAFLFLHIFHNKCVTFIIKEWGKKC